MEPKKKSNLIYVIALAIIIFAVWLSLHMASSYEYVKTTVPVSSETDDGGYFDFALFFDDLGKRLIEKPFEIVWVESTESFLIAALFFCFIIIAYYTTNRKKLISGMEYGSATWGRTKQIKHLFSVNVCKKVIKRIKKSKIRTLEKRKEIKKVKKKYENADMLLTKTESMSLYHEDGINNNTIVVAGSGAGKTSGYAVPNILQACDNDYSPCYIVTDPKGEILQLTGYFLKNVANYKLKVLNLKEQKSSFCYNPFKYVSLKEDAGEMETQIKKLVSAIMEYQNDEGAQKGEAFWTEMAISCLESIFIATQYAFPKKERNMNTVMELFKMFNVKDGEDNFDSDLDLFFKVYEKRFSSDYNAMSAHRKYWEFRNKCRGKTAMSVLATAHSKLAPFDNVNIKRIVESDNMELDKIGEERIAVFVVLPPTEKSFNFFANLMYIQIFDIIEYNATVKHDQKLPIPVRFILDEFFNTGKIPSFENILSYARSFGVSISVILQSLEQLKSMYEKTWGTIIDNCSSFLYLGGVRNIESLEYISKLLGKGTFDKQSSSRTRGRQGSSTQSFDRIGRELLDASEINKIHKRKCLLLINGYNPFYSYKNFYKLHKNYKHTFDADKTNVYEYTPPGEEKEKCTHREESKSEKVKERSRTDSIVFNYDVEKTVEKLEERLLTVDFDEIESPFDDEEVETIKKQLVINNFVEESNNEADRLVDEILLQFKMEEESIAKTTEVLLNNKDDVDFVVPSVNIYHGEEEEEWIEDEDLEISLEKVKIEIGELSEDMEGFEKELFSLNEVDFEENILEDGNLVVV